MDERQVNIPLLRKAVEWAEAEAVKPEIDRRWFQGDWRIGADERAEDMVDDLDLGFEEEGKVAALLEPHCGTAYCIAGYVAQMTDARYAESTTVDDVHVSDAAAKALGISQEVAQTPDGLFYGNNTIGDVRRIAESLAGEPL